jgi:tRNA-splicing ligase RtcB
VSYQVIHSSGASPIKAWVDGVPFAENAKEQLERMARLPFIHKWVAAMPDVHLGKGATVGSVVATKQAIIPAAVGVDIGCGMMAVRTSLVAEDLPDDLAPLRAAIERAVPHGRTNHGGRGDRGAWANPPVVVQDAWVRLDPGYQRILENHRKLDRGQHINHLGTLGTGNHFIEVCLDEVGHVWIMLHSGSRGVGNRIGSHFISLARKEMERWFIHLPEKDLAYLPEGSRYFGDYWDAVKWSQDYARTNRELMMTGVLAAMQKVKSFPEFQARLEAVNCHHNYVSRERHYGKDVYLTRKGAVSAQEGELGIIPGSMGARSFIVRGKGNPESFHSCSHGAGRTMSRTQAKRTFTLDQHRKATAGIECRKDEAVIDETPGAYKSIEAVMAAQEDLVEVVHTLRQVVCVKG